MDGFYPGALTLASPRLSGASSFLASLPGRFRPSPKFAHGAPACWEVCSPQFPSSAGAGGCQTNAQERFPRPGPRRQHKLSPSLCRQLLRATWSPRARRPWAPGQEPPPLPSGPREDSSGKPCSGIPRPRPAGIRLPAPAAIDSPLARVPPPPARAPEALTPRRESRAEGLPPPPSGGSALPTPVSRAPAAGRGARAGPVGPRAPAIRRPPRAARARRLRGRGRAAGLLPRGREGGREGGKWRGAPGLSRGQPRGGPGKARGARGGLQSAP